MCDCEKLFDVLGGWGYDIYLLSRLRLCGGRMREVSRGACCRGSREWEGLRRESGFRCWLIAICPRLIGIIVSLIVVFLSRVDNVIVWRMNELGLAVISCGCHHDLYSRVLIAWCCTSPLD